MPRLSWEAYIQLLKEFTAEYNRVPKKDELYRGIKLGQWCVNQRRALREGKYDNARVQQLNALGITLSPHDEKWEQNFALLQEFYVEYGKFPRQKDHYKGVKLGLWCANQRRDVANGKCLPEREEKLRTIGMLQSNTFDAHWERCFALLQKYVAQYGRFPIETEYYEDFALGKWCSNQKLHAKLPDYPKERMDKLRQIGLLSTTRDAVWEQHYESLQRFVAERGCLPKRNEYYEGFNLGAWCAEQKRKVNAGGYVQERVDKLKALGLPEHTAKSAGWDEMYRMLQEYVQEYHKFPIAKEQYHGLNLGNWCEMQKFLARNTEYPAERMQKLEEIGIFSTTQKAKWDRHYQLLQEFVAEYGRLPKQKEAYRDVKLGLWCTMQKQRYKKAGYLAEHRLKLQEIGLIPRDSLSFFDF